ncbi:unnamed protein product [Euphydryas editha]|uniref:Synaptonemal complex protein 2 n=1 Tax=Euphydryas editha TaxID=104508 RepID=A0AAU9UCQ0_EUPED|nr:unnamed protein product [Euphydryas editha]
MDISKLLKNVNNLNDYISSTQYVITKFSNSKIHFNMSTILALNKIKSIEIEYFNKCDENGVALKILELMLRTPPSKTWGLLGKELVLLIQYWLDALRKHLIVHNNHWWNFLSILLMFIQEIGTKNPAINDILVQETAECLLDIVTRDQPDVVQRYKIIQCLNKFCAESSREIRFALRNKFDVYFVKLSRLLSSCGDLRTQFGILETLLRWLLPRQDLAVRKDASIKWFPSNVYCSKAIDIFLTRPWKNFFMDARDFLNAHNEASDVVISVLCRTFSVGRLALISGTDEKDYWIDLNSGSKCISLMLEPKLLEILGNSLSISDVLVINEDNTSSVEMRGDSEILITLTVSDPQRMYPSNVLEGCDVTISIGTRCDINKVDRALRCIFDNKYQEDETRFSHPVEVPRRKHSGYITRPRKPISWQSPSTASTSSLAMLREKLTAFPGYTFDKEPVSVCALPQLSSVTEVSETEERSVLNASLSTLKLRPYGVCNKKQATLEKKSQSDTESVKEKAKIKCISPVVNNDDDSISCLLVATIGSANDSVINDTLERLPKDKDIHTDNIVDMLAREALNSTRNNEDKADSGFLTSAKIVQDHKNNKENTPFTHTVKKYSKNKKYTTVNNSTTDESNTDVIEDTPHIINIKNRELNNDTGIQQTYDNQTVEEFFSQHVIENREGDIVISPTLAKKINASSSESSEFDFCPIMNADAQFNETEIMDCLNEIIDTVCRNFQECSEYVNDGELNYTKNINKEDPQTVLNKNIASDNKNLEKLQRKVTKNIKLKFANTRKQVKTRGRKKNKPDTEDVKRMSPIIEIDSIIEDKDITKNPEVPKQADDSDTPLIKRKRKLYSPKDDHVVNEKTGVHVSETEEDTILPDIKINENTPKSLATSYKEIESLRRRSIRKLRDRKSRSVPSLSPRTKKFNDMFDSLKKTTEGEKVKLASRKTRSKQYAVYNFTSDSDDDDFKIKKDTKNISKQTSTNNEETVPSRCRRNNTKVNYSEVNYDSTEEQTKKKPKYIRQKKKIDRKNRIVKPKNEMIDERMRVAASEKLNTSIIIEENQEELNVPGPEPILIEPQMEVIVDEHVKNPKKKRSNRNKTDISLNKTEPKRGKMVLEINSDRDNTESPLPGLIIETMQENRNTDGSISDLILEKFKDIDQEGTLPDTSGLNNTQNLLSDIDHNNNSPPNLNITDNFIKDNESQQCNVTPIKKVTTKKPRKRAKVTKTKNERKNCHSTKSFSNMSESNIDIINISDHFEVNSEKTIATVGKSPITGHGDLDESPPSAKQLTEVVQGRGLETQDLNQSMKAYFDKLTNEINEVSNNSTNSNNKNFDRKNNGEKSPTTNSTKKFFEKSPSVSIQRLSAKEISKWLPPRYNSVFGSHQSSDSDTSTRKTRSYTKKNRKSESISDKKSTEKSTQKCYKSIITPVKLYGESDKKEKSISSQGDDYIERIKSLMTTKKEIYKPSTSGTRSKYDLCKHSQDNSSDTTTISKICDVKESGKTVKRKSSPVFEVKKLRKTDDKNSIESLTVESGPSSSSVQDWLRRNERNKLISTAESFDLSMKSNLENIIEKLDTTLVEIHHKTSKKFVNMFVDIQKHLNELKDQRHQMFRDTAKEVMSEVVKIMNDKFENFDRRSQELDEQFIANLKLKAQNLVHEDCKQKRVMVTLLKEDVQNVMEHMKRGRNPDVL